MKLNLGSGTDYRQGFINIDAGNKVKADYHIDLRKKLPFGKASCDFILAQDVLEHLTREEALDFLQECFRLLKTNAKIEIRTHNIYEIFDKFRNDPGVLIKFLYGETGFSGELGSHKYAYTKESLQETLAKAGFKIIDFKKETTNFRLIAQKINIDMPSYKILFSLLDSGGIGGAENFIISLAKRLAGTNRKIVVAFYKKADVAKDVKNKFESYILPFRMDVIGNVKGLIKFLVLMPLSLIINYKKLKDFKSDGGKIVVLTGISDKIILSPLASFLRLNVVWIEYAPLDTVFKKNFAIPKLLYRIVKNMPKVVIVPTYYTKSRLIPATRISDVKIKVIPCGIEK